MGVLGIVIFAIVVLLPHLLVMQTFISSFWGGQSRYRLTYTTYPKYTTVVA